MERKMNGNGKWRYTPPPVDEIVRSIHFKKLVGEEKFARFVYRYLIAFCDEEKRVAMGKLLESKQISVRGSPERALALRMLARIHRWKTEGLPHEQYVASVRRLRALGIYSTIECERIARGHKRHVQRTGFNRGKKAYNRPRVSSLSRATSHK